MLSKTHNEPKRYWRKISMVEAFQIAIERGITSSGYNGDIPYKGLFSIEDVIWHSTLLLLDGSVIACASNWSYDYYDSIDTKSPEFAIGDVRNPKQ